MSDLTTTTTTTAAEKAAVRAMCHASAAAYTAAEAEKAAEKAARGAEKAAALAAEKGTDDAYAAAEKAAEDAKAAAEKAAVAAAEKAAAEKAAKDAKAAAEKAAAFDPEKAAAEVDAILALRPEDNAAALVERARQRCSQARQVAADMAADLGSLCRLILHRQDIGALNSVYAALPAAEKPAFRRALIALMGGVTPNSEKGGYYFAPENSFLIFNTKAQSFTRAVDGGAEWMKAARRAQLEAAREVIIYFSGNFLDAARVKERPVPSTEKDHARKIARVVNSMADGVLRRHLTDALREAGYGDLIKGMPTE